MAKHRHRRRTTYLFKKNAGHWKRFRGNPYKKHIIRGRNPFKRNIAEGFYDKAGKFHPIRSSPDYSPGRVGEGRGKARATTKRTTRRKKHSSKKKRR